MSAWEAGDEGVGRRPGGQSLGFTLRGHQVDAHAEVVLGTAILNQSQTILMDFQ